MKTFRLFSVLVFFFARSQTFGGSISPVSEVSVDALNPKRFEVAVESGYLFGAINPPRDYQIGAEFLTARIRWGVMQSDTFLRGYNQFYISAIAEPIFRGCGHFLAHRTADRSFSAATALPLNRPQPALRLDLCGFAESAGPRDYTLNAFSVADALTGEEIPCEPCHWIT